MANPLAPLTTLPEQSGALMRGLMALSREDGLKSLCWKGLRPTVGSGSLGRVSEEGLTLSRRIAVTTTPTLRASNHPAWPAAMRTSPAPFSTNPWSMTGRSADELCPVESQQQQGSLPEWRARPEHSPSPMVRVLINARILCLPEQ